MLRNVDECFVAWVSQGAYAAWEALCWKVSRDAFGLWSSGFVSPRNVLHIAERVYVENIDVGARNEGVLGPAGNKIPWVKRNNSGHNAHTKH